VSREKTVAAAVARNVLRAIASVMAVS